MYERPLGDFVLDFDYKLSPGCGSGVFLHVGDLGDPLHTGIEVALEDTTGTGYGDSGAFAGLVAPKVNAQKPAGAWNHMRITAQGPRLAVSLNGSEVSAMNLDEWTVAGKRPDGSSHQVIAHIPIADLPHTGYLGFHDRKNDCWFKNIQVSTSALASPVPLVLPSYRVTGQFPAHQVGPIQAVVLTKSGRYALSCGGDGKARLWEIETRRELHSFSHQGMVWSVAISPDGRSILTAGHDRTVGYWERDTGRRIFQYPAHASPVKAVAFFPDGRYALSAGDDGIVILWDLAHHEPLRPIGRHDAEIQCLAISPDGRLALSGGNDRLVRVWDFHSQKELPALGGHRDVITCVAFAPTAAGP